jgi:hypothetical protein
LDSFKVEPAGEEVERLATETCCEVIIEKLGSGNDLSS